MHSYRSRAGKGIANGEASGWKSERFHAMIVWEITYAIIMSSPHNAIYSTPCVMAWVGRFDEEAYASADDKDEYNSNVARWIMSIDTLSHIPGRRPLSTFSNPSETASSSSGGNGRDAYIYWQEVLYYRVRRLSSMFSSKFPSWCRLAILLHEQRDSAPQHLKIAHIVKCDLIIRLLENIVLRLHMTRGQISPAFKVKLDRLQKLIITILRPRNASPHHQGPSSSHEPSVQRAVPSQSGVSPENISELPLMSPQSSHLSKRKSADSEEEKPKKLMKQEAMEYIFSVLKHETPEEAPKEDDDDDFDSAGLDLSLKL